MKYQIYKNGHNTPVLDDYEGIYTIESATIDQSSTRESVEVSTQIKDFTQPKIQEFPKALNSYKALTKQYRSFSGSIKFPPLDNPLTLSPNYKDALVNNYDQLQEIKFKTADFSEEAIKRKEKELAVKRIVERLKYVQSLTNSRTQKRYNHEFQKQSTEQVERNIEEGFREDKKRVKHMQEFQKQDVGISEHDTNKNDLQKIKLTAFDIVDENIKRAVSVAEDIKREIDVEMTDKHQIIGSKTVELRRDDKLKISKTQKESTKEKDEKICDASLKSLTKQRAFSLGLQTIPYMQSYMQSNYFKTMIIKTLFLKLTKFLVSLSRYMLNIQALSNKIYDYTNEHKSIFEGDDKEYYIERILSGAEMSRKFGKTPLDFTERMDKVLSEMEGKTSIERTSRSRSRSRSKISETLDTKYWEDRKETRTMDKLVKNFYIAYVLHVGWSEYYDLGKTTKSEEHWQSSTTKREFIEKLLDEKIIQKDTPLTYVAIVESHVYTNKDAILRDSLKTTELTADSLESKKDSIIVEKKEQTVICTDLQHQVIEIKKDKPMDKVVIVESIEDLTPIDEQKPFAYVEKGATGIAVQNTIEILEPVIEMTSDRTNILKQANSSIEKSSILIAGSEGITLQDEHDKEFVLPDLKPRKSIPLIEPPLQIVAETMEIAAAEPRLEIFEKSDEPPNTIISAVETTVKSIAQTTEVQINEVQTEPLHVFKSTEQKSNTTLEPVVKPVAEIFETFINHPKTEIIDAPHLKTETPKLLFEPLSKTIAVTSEVKTDESNICNFVEKIPILENTKSSIEPLSKTVAQKMELVLNVDNTEILDKIKIQEEYPTTLIETPSQIVATTNETCSDEISVELNGKADANIKNIQSIFEQSAKTVAQKFEPLVNIAELSTFEKMKITEEYTQCAIEIPIKTVAETGEIYVTIGDVGLYKNEEVKKEKTRPNMETPFKSIAEKLEPRTNEEIIEKLEKLNLIGENIATLVESPSKVVAETSQTLINETSADMFGAAITKYTENTHNLIESPHKTVAEKFETYISESGKEFDKFEVKSNKIESSVESPVKIIAETNETYVGETVGVIDKLKLRQENLRSDIETQLKTVAQTNITLTGEISSTFDKDHFHAEKPRTLIESPQKGVAQICETLLNEDGNDFTEKHISTENTNISIEHSFKTVANTKETHVDQDNLGVIETVDRTKEISKGSIETNFKTVAEIDEKILNEESIGMEMPIIKKENTQINIETSFKPVAQRLELFVDKLDIDDFEPIENITEKPHTTLVEPVKVVAENTLVIMDEPKLNLLEAKEFKIVTPKTLMDDSLRFVAEAIIPLIEEPRNESLNVQEIINEEAKIAIDNLEPTIVTEVLLAEPNYESFKVHEIKRKTPLPLMAEPFLAVAETLTTCMEGPKDDILNVPKIGEEHANMHYKASKATKVTDISTLEPPCNLLEVPEIKRSHSQASLVDIKLIAANTEINSPLEPIDDVFNVPEIVEERANIHYKTSEATKVSDISTVESPCNLLEVPEIKRGHPQALLQEIKLIAAKTEINSPLGPKDGILNVPEIIEEHANIHYKTSEATKVADISTLEPPCNLLEVPEINCHYLRALLEEIKLIVANTDINSPLGPKDNILNVPKVVEEYAKMHYKTSEATKVTDISTLEPPCNLLKVSEIIDFPFSHSRTLLEEIRLIAANTEINCPLGPKDDNLLIPNIVNQKANLKINELKAIETSIVCLEEEAQKSSGEFEMDTKKTKMFVEDYVKTVAQKTIVSIEESEKTFFDVSEAFAQSAFLTVQSLAALAQTAVIPLEEVKTSTTPSESSSRKANIFFQESTATDVSQVIAISSLTDKNFEIPKNIKKVESAVESSKRMKAKASEVDVEESKCEIIEIEDDTSLYLDKKTDYTVELADYDANTIIKRQDDLSVSAVEIQSFNADISSLELDTQYIQKDIEYMENGITSIIKSVEADLQASAKSSKAYEKSIKRVLESELIERDESSKSPSPESPVNDFYFFRVETPHKTRREISSEIQSAELDYKSVQKHPFIQGEISVTRSIGIEYQVSDSEDDSEYVEVEYIDETEYLNRQSRKYQTAMSLDAVVIDQKLESQMESEKQTPQRHKLTQRKRNEQSIAQSFSVSANQEHSLQASHESMALHQEYQQSQMLVEESSKIHAGNKKSTNIQALKLDKKSLQKSDFMEIDVESRKRSEASSIAASAKEQQSLQVNNGLREVRQEFQQESSKIHVSNVMQKSTHKQALELDTKSLQKNKSLAEMDIESRKLYEASIAASAKTEQSLQANHGSMEISQEFQQSHQQVQESSDIHVSNVMKRTDIQALELDTKSLQKDISVMEMDIESRHAKLTSVEARSSMKSESGKTKIIEADSSFSIQDDKSPSPPIQPPTPLTDEYMFRLVAPLSSREGTPVPRDCTDSSDSEEETLKNKLNPYIESTIEQRIFDPPLPTPPTSPERRVKPFYSKPGLRGGGDKLDITKEEILEIGRQSTLLASAIGETIKSIEKYKAEAGISTKSDMEFIHTSSSKIESKENHEIKTMERREFKSEDSARDNKVEVLIDKMVETSRRFSGEVGSKDEANARDKDYERKAVSQDTPVNSEQKTCGKEDFPTCSRIQLKEESKERNMDQNKLCDQLMRSVQSMVDPNASLEERLKQVQAQMAELSRLPDLIQKTLDGVKLQFEQLNQQVQQKTFEIQTSQSVQVQAETHKQFQVSEQIFESKKEESLVQKPIIEVTESAGSEKMIEQYEPKEIVHSVEEDTEIQNIVEKRRLEAENKSREEIMKERLSQELRIARERLSPKLGLEGRSTPSFAPEGGFTPNLGLPEIFTPILGLQETASPKLDVAGPAYVEPARPVTPAKMWKKLDAYDDANLEQVLSETLAAQAEVIQGKAIGVNFKKYEKPPAPLDHLQHSEVYKAIHEMDQKPLKKVELLKPAIAASDYVERVRSVSPNPAKTLIEDCEV